MGARTGKQYLDALRDGRSVRLNGEPIADVTDHPATAGTARTIAGLYDLQHDAADVCLTTDAASGESVSWSHVIPRGKADLAARHACLERIALYSAGLLGRSPDYLNVTFAGFAGREDVWARNGNEEGAANLVAFQRDLALRDLALTHTIVHPTVDKSLPEVAGGGGEVCLRKVGETEHGIVVSGARALATLAPVSDEIAVYPGQPIAPDATPYALSFSIPVDTPGLQFLCRDSYATSGSRFDHPFSTRFDEHDAVVLFDKVEVPRNRVFLDGDTDVYNKVMAAGWVANIMQQTSIRAAVKLEFAYELLTRLADAVNANDPGTSQLLGEVWTYWELTRAAIVAAETGAYEWGNGTWFCDERPFRALRPTLPGWFPRVNEIFKLMGAHNLLTTPTRAELDDPVLRPLIDHHYQGADGFPAEERIRLFRAAWDYAGTALASRNELYERFYLASAARMYQVAHMNAKRERTRSVVDMVLAPEHPE